MAVIFGQFGTTLGTLAAPPPEHSSQRRHAMASAGTSGGAWLHPAVSAKQSLFSGVIGGMPVACLCDSELSNTAELKQELRSRSGSPESDSPAELIAHLVAGHGPEAFARLHGGFACAVSAGSRSWLAVDRFGMKRMAYGFHGDSLLFSSRLEWLSQVFGEVSPRAVYQYLNFGFVPSPETIYRSVHKLPAGTFITWEGRGPAEPRAYWKMAYREDLAGSEAEMASELRRELHDAVGATTAGLDPQRTGFYLSGGTDSSTVVGMAADVWRQSPHAFSIGFADEEFSEMHYSRLAVKHFGAAAHEYIVQADDGWRSLPALAKAFDEPFGNSSAVGGYVCADMAAKAGVEVMLAGDGGDELFGGNERYRKDRIYSWLNRLPRFMLTNPLLDACWAVTSNVAASVRLKKILFRASLPNPERFYLEDCLSADLNGDFVSADLAEAAGDDTPLNLMKRSFDEASATSELNRLLYLDLKFTISDNDLVKVRQTAAACGVRVRFPMLDAQLVEFSGRMPAEMKVKGLEKRYLFKRALADFLPQEILEKKKHGFGVPVSLWFRDDKRFRDLLLDVTSDRATSQRGYFQPGTLQKAVDEHLRGIWDWGGLLWSALMLELWHREAAGAEVHREAALAD